MNFIRKFKILKLAHSYGLDFTV